MAPTGVDDDDDDDDVDWLGSVVPVIWEDDAAAAGADIDEMVSISSYLDQKKVNVSVRSHTNETYIRVLCIVKIDECFMV